MSFSYINLNQWSQEKSSYIEGTGFGVFTPLAGRKRRTNHSIERLDYLRDQKLYLRMRNCVHLKVPSGCHGSSELRSNLNTTGGGGFYLERPRALPQVVVDSFRGLTYITPGEEGPSFWGADANRQGACIRGVFRGKSLVLVQGGERT